MPTGDRSTPARQIGLDSAKPWLMRRSDWQFLASQPIERGIGIAEDRDLTQTLCCSVSMGQPQLIGGSHDSGRNPRATRKAWNQDFVNNPLELVSGQLRNRLADICQRSANRETDRVLEHPRPESSYVGRPNIAAPRLMNYVVRRIVGVLIGILAFCNMAKASAVGRGPHREVPAECDPRVVDENPAFPWVSDPTRICVRRCRQLLSNGALKHTSRHRLRSRFDEVPT